MNKTKSKEWNKKYKDLIASLGALETVRWMAKLREMICLLKINWSWIVAKTGKTELFFLHIRLAVTAGGWVQATLSASRIQPQRSSPTIAKLLPLPLRLAQASSMPLRHLFKYYHEGRPQHTPAATAFMEFHCLGCRPARPWAALSPQVNSAACTRRQLSTRRRKSPPPGSPDTHSPFASDTRHPQNIESVIITHSALFVLFLTTLTASHSPLSSTPLYWKKSFGVLSTVKKMTLHTYAFGYD